MVIYTLLHLICWIAGQTFRTSPRKFQAMQGEPGASGAHKICTSHAIHLWYVHNYSHYSRKCICIYLYVYIVFCFCKYTDTLIF